MTVNTKYRYPYRREYTIVLIFGHHLTGPGVSTKRVPQIRVFSEKPVYGLNDVKRVYWPIPIGNITAIEAHTPV